MTLSQALISTMLVWIYVGMFISGMVTILAIFNRIVTRFPLKVFSVLTVVFCVGKIISTF